MTAVAEAVDLLRGGGVVGLPTDTVYGLAAVPTAADGIARLYEMKGRPAGKPIALLVGSPEQAAELVWFSAPAAELAERHWPGALTLVLYTRVELPEWVGDRTTAGVRMPDHPLALEVLTQTGPLAVTSANPAGAEPASDHHGAEALFGPAVDLYLPGACPGEQASTVVDATGADPVVLRYGPIRVSVES